MKSFHTKITDHLYIKIANTIEAQIANEVIKIGERLPSVRILCKEHGVSLSTVLQAYYHLESKGLIEVRPQSGYYVRFSHRKYPAIPEKSKPVEGPLNNHAEEIITSVYSNLADQSLIKFSLSVPAPELLPIAKLNKTMIECMRTLPAGGTNYEDIQGNPELRRQIAKWSMLWDGNLTGNDIVTTAGCMNAVAFSLMALTERGDTIAVESPTYFGILQLASNLGLKVYELPTDPQTGIDVDALKKTLQNHTIKVCVIMTNFNNPIGSCMPDENKKEVVRLIEHHHVPLIEDDLYGDVYFAKSRPKSCKTFDDSGLVLWCGSVSKTLAPGYRVGWVAPGMFLDKIKMLKMYHIVSSSTLEQEAVARFLGNGRYEHHLRKLRNTLQSNSLQYARAITEYFPEGTKITRPQGGFLIWVELNKMINTFDLYKEAMKHGISIGPGRMFTLQDQYNHCMRLSYGLLWNPQIDNALKILGNLVYKMKR
jgi:DNA-binding transcriptional MocR family regulator